MHHIAQFLATFHITVWGVVFGIILWSLAATLLAMGVTLLRERLYLRRQGDLCGFDHFQIMFQTVYLITLVSSVGFFYEIFAHWAVLTGS